MRTLAAFLALLLLLGGCDAIQPAESARSVRYVVEGDAAVTFLAPDGLHQVTSTTRWETRLDTQAGAPLSLEAVSVDLRPVVVRIEVGGEVVRQDRGTRARVDVRTGDDAGEIEIHGPVEARGGDRVTVGGHVFVVDGSTRLLGRDNQAVPLTTFSVGTFVEAEGHRRADGTYRAKKIKLDDDDARDEHEVEVEGRIDSINSDRIVVAGTAFATDAATRWMDDDNRLISRSSFRVGDRVEAEGHRRGGVLYAEKVKQDDD